MPLAGTLALDVDGGFGPLTHEVVIAFQRKQGRGPGTVGPMTWTKLNQLR